MISEHCIVYADRSSHNRKSAIIFDEHLILAPATVLFGCLSQKSARKVSRDLLTYSMIDVPDETNNNQSSVSKELTSLQISVVHKRQQSLVTSKARINYWFNCKNISESVEYLLDNFEPLVLSSDGLVPKSTDVESDMHMFLLSSFVVLNMGGDKPIRNIVEMLQGGILPVEGLVQFDTVNKLDDIASVTTPFTNEVFFGTVNVGKVANLFGNDNCLFVASQPLVGGCEGGAVYNRKMNVIGMVICTSFRWKRSQNASLTLVASFSAIVKEFMKQSISPTTLVAASSPLIKHSNLEKSVLLIQIGSSGGSGCLLKIHSFRFILTCSHVVFDVPPNTKIICHWRHGSFESEVIYKNPNFAQAYDVALLTVPANIPDEFFTECERAKPVVGNLVYATGFPHFFALAKQQFAPSIFEGRVTKVENGLIFTDASVQAGQSGGPLLNANGLLVGVMVSNSRDADDQIYPHVNMCIPVCDIYESLVAFSESKDSIALNGLLADQTIVRRWNLQPPPSVLWSKL